MKLSGVSFVLEHAQNFKLNLVLVPVLVRNIELSIITQTNCWKTYPSVRQKSFNSPKPMSEVDVVEITDRKGPVNAIV